MKKTISIILGAIGFLFLLYYLNLATLDVVYTDYIRLTNSYLKDVFSIKPYMSLDILTRTPISYFERIINVVFFSYSTKFDMILGIIFLSINFMIFAKFMSEKKYSIFSFFIVFILVFSLNKWEMLTNGSGWVHFLAITLFVFHFYLFSKIRRLRKESKNYSYKAEILLHIIPIVTIPLIAGPYGISYAVIINLIYIYDVYKSKFNERILVQNIKRSLSINIPLLLYFLSSYFAVYDHAGATDKTIVEVFNLRPFMFLSFFIKSFASMVFSIEYVDAYLLSNKSLYIIGGVVIFAYVYAFYLNIKNKIYKKSLFPLILLMYGFLNHILVSLSRWIFLQDNYGMSSRYALQYHIGIVGIILSICYSKKFKINISRIISFLIIMIFIFGNIVTTKKELEIAKYRKEHFENRKRVALNFENESDETLRKVFQYRSGEKVRTALEILRERKLNVFK